MADNTFEKMMDVVFLSIITDDGIFRGLTFHKLVRPCSVVISLIDDVKSLEEAVLQVASCDPGFSHLEPPEYGNMMSQVVSGVLPLREEMSRWRIGMEHEAWELVDRAESYYRDAHCREISYTISTMKRIGDCGGFGYFYLSKKNPGRLAALSAARWYDKILVPALGRWVANVKSSVSVLDWRAFFREALTEGWRFALHERALLRCAQDDLSKYGTLLKVGKFLSYAGKKGVESSPHTVEHEIEVLSHYVSDLLRGKRPLALKVQVSDTPSEVYGKPHKDSETLGHSCMRHKSAAYFHLYDDLPCCKIAYVMEGKTLVGRALIWDDARVDRFGTDKRVKIMDRVYFADRDVLAVLLKWGKDNGYLVKKYPDRGDCCSYIDKDNNEYMLMNLVVEAEDNFTTNQYASVPYMDTFMFVEEGAPFLYSWNYSDECTELRSTEGDGDFLTGNPSSRCEHCGSRFSNDELSLGPDGYLYCDTCFDNAFAVCSHCHEYVDKNDIVFVEDWDENICDTCASEILHRCDDCCGYWKQELHPVYTRHGIIGYCSDCADNHETDGDISRCPECGEYCDTDIMRTVYAAPASLVLPFDDPSWSVEHAGDLLEPIEQGKICPSCAARIIEEQTEILRSKLKAA